MLDKLHCSICGTKRPAKRIQWVVNQAGKTQTACHNCAFDVGEYVKDGLPEGDAVLLLQLEKTWERL